MVAQTGPDAIRDVLAVLPEASLLLDLDGRIEFANPPARRALALPEPTPDKSLHELVGDAEQVESLIRRWRTSSAFRPGGLRLASGRTFRCDGARVGRRPLIVCRLVEAEQATAGFGRLSERVAAENLRQLSARLEATVRELDRANHLLTVTNTELEEYASAVSHDLRTPLYTVQGYAELLLDTVEDDPDGREYARAILESTQRLRRIIDAMLAVARIPTGTPPREPVDTEAAFAAAVADHRDEIERVDAEIVAGPLLPVLADFTALTQVFANLVANAVKFRHPDRRLRIEVASRRRSDVVELTVADNGIGVPERDRERIFELFQRGTADHSDEGGTGIGLATCRKLVTWWGGTITCHAASEQGTAFVFTAPAPV